MLQVCQDRSLTLVVAALLLVLAVVVFITALGDYLLQPMSVSQSYVHPPSSAKRCKRADGAQYCRHGERPRLIDKTARARSSQPVGLFRTITVSRAAESARDSADRAPRRSDALHL
jgi:hypothetical protein